MTIRAILWDFGDTLADERWMLAPLQGVPGWPGTYKKICGSVLGEQWNSGFIGARSIASACAAELGVHESLILGHMQACSRKVRFYERVMDYARSCRIPQLIATINPDIFSAVVAKEYGLHSVFAGIITSWQERTLIKSELCDIAARRLKMPRDGCLLIDNNEGNVRDWVRLGGRGYHFRGEETFCSDFAE